MSLVSIARTLLWFTLSHVRPTSSRTFETLRSPPRVFNALPPWVFPKSCAPPAKGPPHPHTLVFFFGRGRDKGTKDIHELSEGRNQSSTSLSLLAPLFSPCCCVPPASGCQCCPPLCAGGRGNSFGCVSCGVDVENGYRLVALRA